MVGYIDVHDSIYIMFLNLKSHIDVPLWIFNSTINKSPTLIDIFNLENTSTSIGTHSYEHGYTSFSLPLIFHSNIQTHSIKDHLKISMPAHIFPVLIHWFLKFKNQTPLCICIINSNKIKDHLPFLTDAPIPQLHEHGCHYLLTVTSSCKSFPWTSSQASSKSSLKVAAKNSPKVLSILFKNFSQPKQVTQNSLKSSKNSRDLRSSLHSFPKNFPKVQNYPSKIFNSPSYVLLYNLLFIPS